jgi:hypothetical protein
VSNHRLFYEKTTTGKLLSADPRAILRGPDGEQIKGIALKSAGAIALIELRAGRQSQVAIRRFHLGIYRYCWLNVVGYENIEIDIVEVGEPTLLGETPSTVSYAWLTEPPPQIEALVYWQEVAAAGRIEVPEGAKRLIASTGDPGAFQENILGPTTFALNTPLVSGVESAVYGKYLTLSAPNTLCWILEGL